MIRSLKFVARAACVALVFVAVGAAVSAGLLWKSGEGEP